MHSLEDFYKSKEHISLTGDKEAYIRLQRALRLCGDIGEKILDIGCRDGHLRGLLSDGVAYHGIDIVETVPESQWEFPNQFKWGRADQEMFYPHNYFDTIFALEIIEHVRCPIKFIENAKSMLKNQGVLMLSVPNPYSPWEILANYRKEKETQGHISSFTHQNIQRLMDFTGMEIIDIRGTSFKVPVIRRILRVFKGKDYRVFIKTNSMFLSRSFIYKCIKRRKNI